MAIGPTILPTFDLSVLNSYYSSTAALDPTTARAVLQAKIDASVGGKGVEPAPTDVTPPWQTPQALAQAQNPTTPTEQDVFQNAGTPLFNPNDPSLDRPDVTQDFKNLFALYQGLNQINTLASFVANSPDAAGQSTLLNNQFQKYLQELNTFVAGATFQNLTLIQGIQQSTDSSTAQIPTAPTSYLGGFVTSRNDIPVPGLDYTGKFTINVTDTATGKVNSVLIDLSQVGGGQTINDIANYINAQIGANGNIQSSVAVSQNGVGNYGLQFFTASGESISFQADPSSQQPAAYIAGTSGGADTAQSFLTKYQDLNNPTPTQAFTKFTSAVQPISTAGGSTSAVPTVGDITTSVDPTTGLPTSTVAPSVGPPTESAGVTGNGIAKDSNGNIYVVGTTDGELGGRVTGGTNDAYLQKYDPSGKLVWTRDLGASGAAQGAAVTVDANNNVIVTGQTSVPLTADSAVSLDGANNTFVTKYDQSGQELFSYEPSTVANNGGNAVTTDVQGNIFVAGSVNGVIDGSQTSGGGNDAYFSKIDSNGNVVYSQQFGGAGDQAATAIQVDNQGHVFVLYNDSGHAKLSEYADAAGGSPIFTTDLGAVGTGAATGLALDGSGNVYVTGSTDGGNLNGPAQNSFTGSSDGFVQQINAQTGAINYVSYIGSTGATQATSVSVSGSSVFVTGTTTAALPGASQSSGQDGFLATLNSSNGALTQATQFGNSAGAGVLVDPTGDSVLSHLGLPNGSAPGLVDPDGAVVLDAQSAQAQIGARVDQSLTISVNGGLKQTVTLGQGDSLLSIATNIQAVLGTNGTARVADDGIDQQNLQITATNGAQITLGDGPQGFDLLKSLGLQAETIYAPAPSTSSQSTTPISPFLRDIESTPTTTNSSASIFQLGLTDNLNLSDKKSATDAATLIQSALVQIKKAYSFLTQGPPPPPTPAATGQASTETTNQIKQFQAAALQLGIGYGGSGSSGAAGGYTPGSGAASLLGAQYASSSGGGYGNLGTSYASALGNFVQPIGSA